MRSSYGGLTPPQNHTLHALSPSKPIRVVLFVFPADFIPSSVATRCITFLYHELDGTDNRPSLASMDFSAAAKTVKGSASGKGHGFRGRYRLIVASNRDEYLDRATAPIHFWKDADQNLLAGTYGDTYLDPVHCYNIVVPP